MNLIKTGNRIINLDHLVDARYEKSSLVLHMAVSAESGTQGAMLPYVIWLKGNQADAVFEHLCNLRATVEPLAEADTSGGVPS